MCLSRRPAQIHPTVGLSDWQTVDRLDRQPAENALVVARKREGVFRRLKVKIGRAGGRREVLPNRRLCC